MVAPVYASHGFRKPRNRLLWRPWLLRPMKESATPAHSPSATFALVGPRVSSPTLCQSASVGLPSPTPGIWRISARSAGRSGSPARAGSSDVTAAAARSATDRQHGRAARTHAFWNAAPGPWDIIDPSSCVQPTAVQPLALQAAGMSGSIGATDRGCQRDRRHGWHAVHGWHPARVATEEARMLKGIDHRLNAEVLACLRAMGHGDVLIVADTNFPGRLRSPARP